MAKYSVYCETSARREYWETVLDPVEECPVDLAHTVRTGSLTYARSTKKNLPLASICLGTTAVITETSQWQTIDQRMVKPSAEVDVLSRAFWNIACSIKVVGSTSRILLVETELLPTPVSTVLENIVVPDTGGNWERFTFNTSVPLNIDWRELGIAARRGSPPSTSFEIRGIVATLLERTR